MCGIAACVGAEQSALVVKYLLLQLQHRGQEGAGLAWIQDGSIRFVKNFGYVTSALPDVQDQTRLAIGHVRYSTTGTYMKSVEELHPFVIQDGVYSIAFAFNGTIFNFHELRKELTTHYTFVTNTDTEVVAKLIHLEYKRRRDLVDALVHVAQKLRGSLWSRLYVHH